MILSYGKIMKKCISHLVTCGPEKNKLHLKKRKMKTFLQIQRVACYIFNCCRRNQSDVFNDYYYKSIKYYVSLLFSI